MRGGTPQMQRGSKLSNFHLASVAGKNFQHAGQAINHLNGRTAPNGSFFSAFAGWLWLWEHGPDCETTSALWDERCYSLVLRCVKARRSNLERAIAFAVLSSSLVCW